MHEPTKVLEFVDIEKVNPRILVDIRYATNDNFTSQKVYPISKCFLRKRTAWKLNNVQKELEKRGVGLKVWDGYRPLHVQWIFWKLVPDERFVGNPARSGSKHNRGAAVDVTLVDQQGRELFMPSGFDEFSEKAFRNSPNTPKEAQANSKLLEDLMYEQGFIGYPSEWWHYEDTEWESYPIEDISLEELAKI
jgi:D-alanyl-D-alanine dipeptidase